MAVPANKTVLNPQQREADRIWLTQLLGQAQFGAYYGKLVLVMEGGVIRRVVKEEMLLPPPTS